MNVLACEPNSQALQQCSKVVSDTAEHIRDQIFINYSFTACCV